MKILNMEQGSHEWLAMRKDKITATDISKIMGINKWCTPLLLWKRKLSIVAEEPENPAMRMGSKLEPAALERFIVESGIHMQPAIVLHETETWKMASLDGLSECGKIALEIKCSQQCYLKATQGIIDDIYRHQIQWQMHCADLEEIYFAAYWDDEISIMTVQRDDEFLDEIMPKIIEFHKCIVEIEEPALSEKDYVSRNDTEWKKASLHYLESKKMLEYWEKVNAEQKKKLIEFSNEQNCVGGGVSLCRIVRKGAVDYQKVLIDHGIDDVSSYRKPDIFSYRISEKNA